MYWMCQHATNSVAHWNYEGVFGAPRVRQRAVIDYQVSMVSGFSSEVLSLSSHSAPSAPSMTR